MYTRRKYMHQCFHMDYEQRCWYHKDFHLYHRCLRWGRPLVFIFHLSILYLLFKWIGNQTVSIFFAVFISIKEIIHLSFLWRLENKIFKPMDQLKAAVDEIAKGNYNVKVEYEVTNEFGVLIHSFNKMAEQLQQSEKVKLAYEENRKTLIANISHDLKTPIASIQGYIEAIRDGFVESQEKVNKYLKIIHHNTIYMNKLIDDLFLFSKLDMEKLDFQYEDIEIRPYMEDLMEEFKFDLEERQIQFTYKDKVASKHYVRLDRKRIQQAIRNIIGNAVKYGNKENLAIEVGLLFQNDLVCIEIKDNGPGISTDKLPYIFNRFYRIDHERTKDFMSTGLGLAIAKELVEAHGGKITVSSIAEEGSCFTIMLPVVK
ncbi:sensor histidine kinase [Geosporobacter ferrireducens]|uniref:histidine kinase n=1 Tax=Geosporobacter ferrireducens TaxID=1424294 RepID=A0A1D8GII6_9FIRM|nr:HAMP domain-containing sensor histidine kinase [Geosporobacter ferrireducens]AOT70726.1 two-component sensor histidine kinase [Geosporobacter ferrireducens]MTI57530.1 HAMP domain-containing histidine kinase [Geosporobacter ferrireducens]